jgi:murein DD-endopeptidase MepM/ murein hydrolase activator NlpD
MIGCVDAGSRPIGDDESGSTDGSSGSMDTSDTQTSEATTGETDDTDDTDDTTDEDTSTGEGCPEPQIPPMLVDDPAVFCADGFSFDQSYRLCVSETEAIGPFPPAMVAACEACGGVDCTGSRWPADQARGLRGADMCWPGTMPLDPICVDDEHGWGPFTPSMVAGCKAAGGGDVTCESMRWARDFAENLLPGQLGADWVWIMPVDLGLRDDASGGGAFSAPRFNNPGGHSGIDILASVGTPLLAPCEGPVFTGYDGGYGNYVQLICEMPTVLAGDDSLWASILFAHLDSLAVNSNEVVTPGQMVGAVGKTGNANSPGINAHVHFEIAIHASFAAAQGESHASSDHSGNVAGDLFAIQFDSECLAELDFVSTSGPSMKGRRADPFMLLTCLSSNKPDLEAPAPALQTDWVRWSDHYDAAAFDVDVGL